MGAAVDGLVEFRRDRGERCFLQVAERGVDALGARHVDRLAGELLGVGPFEEPGGGAPVGAGSVFHQLQGIGRLLEGESDFVVEVLVVAAFPLDGSQGNIERVGGLLDAVAFLGDEFAEAGLLRFVEKAAAAADVVFDGHWFFPPLKKRSHALA